VRDSLTCKLLTSCNQDNLGSDIWSAPNPKMCRKRPTPLGREEDAYHADDKIFVYSNKLFFQVLIQKNQLAVPSLKRQKLIIKKSDLAEPK
jgi:hypothetical protein